MAYNPDIHHRHSIRLKEYDYSQAGLYFITICVKNNACLFGKITDGKICLSAIGAIADVLWHEIKNHAKNVELHEFVVMPNHIHGIIEITTDDGVGATVGAGHALPLPPQPQTADVRATHALPQSRFQNQGKNTISSIVGSYKSAVSKHAHRLGFAEFAWQRNYWENIIRSSNDYTRIAQYIINNPINWNEDKFYIS
jgi:REP element-mobilizing transposase RayT